MNADVQMLLNKTVRNPYGFRVFINNCNELILDPKLNIYFWLGNVETELDYKCKVLEFMSFFVANNHNMGFLKKSRRIEHFINYILGTHFTHDDFQDIYCKLGNRVHHDKTIAFVKSGYDMNLLRRS